VILADLPDDKFLTLRWVCELAFDRLFSVQSLMIEHTRGNLQISKIGPAYITTPADLAEMFRKCRDEASTRYFGPVKKEERMRALDEATATLFPSRLNEAEQKGPLSMVDQMSLADRMRRHRLLAVSGKHPGSEGTEGAKTVSLSELPDDVPLSLKEVCEQIFGGSISVASLMIEHKRGNLQINKVGRKYFTTPADLRSMYVKCRVAIPPHVPFPRVGGANQEDRARIEAAREALKLTLKRLKSKKANT